MIIVLAIGWSWAGDAPNCPRPLTTNEIELAARRVQDFLIEDNGAVIRARRANDDMANSLYCLGEPLTPSSAAEILLSHGLITFFSGEVEDAALWFLSARAAAPTLSLDPELAPHEQHPLAVQWSRAREAGGSTPLPTLETGLWFVNGRPSASAPTLGPYMLQRVAPDGTIVETRLIVAPVDADSLAASGTGGESSEDDPTKVAVQPTTALVEQSRATIDNDLVSTADVAAPSRPFPTRTVLGGATFLGGVVLSSAVFFNRGSLCDLPDANGDGNFDCPSGTSIAFWGGLGGMVVGSAVVGVGIRKELRQPQLSVGRVGPHTWGANLSFFLDGRTRPLGTAW